MNIHADTFLELNYDAIPLRPGSKVPAVYGWPKRDPLKQWRTAADNANIGLRGGGGVGLAVIDADEKNKPGTADQVRGYLAGLGYLPGDYPEVQTASGVGRHFYVSFVGYLPGDYRIFADDFGAGEFRFGPGSMSVAAPSLVDGGQYILLDGDYRQLPRIDSGDIFRILDNTQEASKRPTVTRLARAILSGQVPGRYRSRSEAEAAAVLSLVNAGFDYPAILALFEKSTGAGKFAELRSDNPKKAEHWLRRTFQEVRDYGSLHDSRAVQTIRAIIARAESRPWAGRTGSVDRAVYLAHLAIALRAGRISYAASCRELAEMAGCGSRTAAAASRRLKIAKLLDVEQKAVADSAHIYKLVDTGQGGTLPHSEVLRECATLSTIKLVDDVHNVPLPHSEVLREWNIMHTDYPDAFRYRGLGKSAYEVWRVLQDGPRTVNELADITGRHCRTVKRALARMAHIVDSVTGEIVYLVERDGDCWRACEADLGHVAVLVRTAGAGERQKRQHSRDRRAHRRGLEKGLKDD